MSGLKSTSTKYHFASNQENFMIEIPCRRYSTNVRDVDEDDEDDDAEDDNDMDVDNDLDDDYEEGRGGRVGRGERMNKVGKVGKEGRGTGEKRVRGDKKWRRAGWFGRKKHEHEQEEQEQEEQEQEQGAEELEAAVRFKHHRLLGEEDFNDSSNEDEESAKPRGIAEGSRMKKGKQPVKANSIPNIPSFNFFYTHQTLS
jgi:hypothetical protein